MYYSKAFPFPIIYLSGFDSVSKSVESNQKSLHMWWTNFKQSPLCEWIKTVYTKQNLTRKSRRRWLRIYQPYPNKEIDKVVSSRHKLINVQFCQFNFVKLSWGHILISKLDSRPAIVEERHVNCVNLNVWLILSLSTSKKWKAKSTSINCSAQNVQTDEILLRILPDVLTILVDRCFEIDISQLSLT